MESGVFMGLMSGTSMDGIDAALLEWDSEGKITNPLQSVFVEYATGLKERLETVIATAGREGDVMLVQKDLTKAHAEACARLLAQSGREPSDVRAVGFHGHTVVHRPGEGITWQIGDAALLCELSGIDVVADFRTRDVAAGGQGAPLLPLYHAALVEELRAAEGEPACYAVVNIGGVANVTFVSFSKGEGERQVTACDTGPGNALLDDWVRRWTDGKQACDEGGRRARQGDVKKNMLEKWLAHPFFSLPPPKSLDRNAFHEAVMADAAALSECDGAATLLQLTVETIVATAERHAPAPVTQWLVTGGGRHNAFLMDRLQARCAAPVASVDEVGWNGDMLEAEGRVLMGEALSLPGTTGVSRPTIGGSVTRRG